MTEPHAPLQSFNQPPPTRAPRPLMDPQPVYEDHETPPPRSSGQPPERRTPFAHLPTDYLNRVQKDLRSNIPSDPTFLSHVGTLLRALVQFDLSDPKRLEIDQQEAERAAAEADERRQKAMADRHEQEKAALPPGDENEAAALSAKHEQEVAAAERGKRLEALATKQAQDAKDFAEHQRQEREEAAA
jgi:hypothetical protein